MLAPFAPALSVDDFKIKYDKFMAGENSFVDFMDMVVLTLLLRALRPIDIAIT